MSTAAYIVLLSTWVVITVLTGYFFLKVLKAPSEKQ